MHTPISVLASMAAEVLCAHASARRRSMRCVTMQHAPKAKILFFGLVPWRSSFGVDGELREFIRELRMCAIAL